MTMIAAQPPSPTASSVFGDIFLVCATRLRYPGAARAPRSSRRRVSARERAPAAGEKTSPPPPVATPSGSGRADPHALHVEVGGIGAKAASVTPELTRRLREFILRELAHTPGLT